MGIDVRAYTNADEATVVWRPSGAIPGCRGYAVARQGEQADGTVAEATLETYVGFVEATPAAPGTHRPSTVWPVQRLVWRDYGVEAFTRVRYRIIPMLGAAGALAPAPDDQCSDWSAWTPVGTGQTPGFRAYFNRGIVATQWLTRRLAVPPSEERRALGQVIVDPTSSIRAYLGGTDRVALLGLLADAKATGKLLYLALYELDDPELVPALLDVGANAKVVLADGAFGPDKPDENAAVRAQLKASGSVEVHDRLVTGSHFAHNKFVVVCDPDGSPRQVWTGSTNWTKTGLCTQANNGLLIDDATLAAGYLAYWQRLVAAGDDYPPTLVAANQEPITSMVGPVRVTAWTTPVAHLADLEAAKALIQGAKQGVLFLMFIPGTQGTLLDDILALDDRQLFVHGVINQDPGGSQHPTIGLVQRGNLLPADPDVILPAAISAPLATWQPELKQYSTAMIHSKVVVVDPFGDHPVVMTGSHNLGPKASSQNDDNLVIIENAPGLAAEYAVNITGIYDQYKWRYNMLQRAKAAQAEAANPAPVGAAGATSAAAGTPDPSAAAGTPDPSAAAGTPAPTPDPSASGATPTPSHPWSGLQDDDAWQAYLFDDRHQREIRFWFGESPAAPSPVP